jgi:hypothetical protein
VENLRKKIAEAKKIADELGLEEPYKSEAFGAVLTQLLQTERAKEKLEKPTHVEIGLDKRIEKFAKNIGVTIDQLKQIFDFEEDNLILIKEPVGTQEEKQVQATLLILTGLSYCYEKEQTLATDLKRMLDQSGIDLKNLSTNLKKYRQRIIPRGMQGSHNFTYKITGPGKSEGLRLIREFI